MTRRATWAALLLAAALTAPTQSEAAKRPLVYTRLRVDPDYLPVYRNWHTQLPFEEREARIRLLVNETSADGSAKQVAYEYYENANVDANNLTLDDLILESLDQVYRSHLIQSHVYSYDNPDDLRAASDKRLVSAERCDRELDFLLDRAREFERIAADNARTPIDPEVAAFFDAYSPVEQGVLQGNVHWVGNWQQCKRRLIFDPRPLEGGRAGPPIRFSGRHCLAAIRSSHWAELIERRSVELEALHFKYPEQKFDYRRFFRIQVGFCLPESCDSTLLQRRPVDVKRLATARLTQPFKSYELVDLFCLPDETSELRQLSASGRGLVALLLGWACMCAAATLVDLSGRHPNEDSALFKWMSACSVARNAERFADLLKSRQASPSPSPKAQPGAGLQLEGVAGEPQPQPRPEAGPKLADLFFLDFFKFYAMLFIIMGHVTTGLWQGGKYSPDNDQFGHGLYFHLMGPSAVFYVDWFFAISGLILSYSMFARNKVRSMSALQWLYTVFHRYWRLAPLYVLTFWFTKSLFHQLGSGPLWDYGTSNMTLRAICQRESWAWPLLLASNWHPLHEECVLPSWYLSSDMQFYLLAPPLLVALAKRPLLAWAASGCALLGWLLLRFARYMTDPRAKHFDLIHVKPDCYMRNSWDMHPTYLYPHYRFGSYLMGVLAGHYAYMVMSGQWRSPIYARAGRLSGARRLARTATLVGGFGILVPMTFATLFFVHAPEVVERHARLLVSVSYATHHALAAAGMVLVSLGLLFGAGRGLRRFMARPLWSALARLNYVVLLIQAEVINWFKQTEGWPTHPNPSNGVRLWLAAILSCYAAALPLSVLFEMPLAQLEQQFVSPLFFPRPKREPAKRRSPAPDSPSLVAAEPPAKSAGAEHTRLVGAARDD